MSGESDRTAFWIASGFIGTALVGAFIALSVMFGEDFFITALIMAGVAGTIVLRGPLGRAIARRIEAGPAAGADAELAAESAAEILELRTRMGELEERVDFAERLLAQTREAPRLEREGA
jgi:hypothetical protein